MQVGSEIIKAYSLPKGIGKPFGRTIAAAFAVLMLMTGSAVLVAMCDTSLDTVEEEGRRLVTEGCAGISDTGTQAVYRQMSAQSKGLPSVPDLVQYDPCVICTRVCGISPEAFTLDLTLQSSVTSGGLFARWGTLPESVPETYGPFSLSLNGSECTFVSQELLPGKGEMWFSVPVIYGATDRYGNPEDGSLQVIWLLNLVFSDSLVLNEGGFHVR